MASNPLTNKGIQTSFGNTPQAGDDLFFGSLGGTLVLDVMSNDLGGNSKSLWSLDDGNSAKIVNQNGSTAPKDLLTQDTARTEAASSDTSANGAKIWITSDGKVDYDSSTLDPAFITLLHNTQAGQYVTDSFTYAIQLGNGTLSWATATVKFEGLNHGPVAVADTASVKEDTNDAAHPNPVSSNVLSNDTDVDVGDTHTVTAVNGSSAKVGVDVAGTYGTLHLNADGTYTYALDNSKASVQALAEGQQTTEVFTYTNSDNHGGSNSSTLTITITGTNDKPVITSGTQAGAVQEDVQLTATGQVQASDVDTGDHQHYSGNATGTYGSFAIAATTGVWTYTLDNAAHQDLAQGESHTEIHTVTVTDDFGGTTTQDVTITITGTNDKPVITSGTQAGAVQEDVQLTATGQVQASDVDTGDHQHYSGNATGTYGSFAIAATTGVWTYTLDNAAHQDLAQGESHTEIHTVTVTDDFGGTTTQDVTITITGTNDKPVITSGTQAGAVQEDVQLTATGQVQASDVDTGDHQHYSGNATGTYGSFAIAATTGVWTYTLDNAAHQDLAQGESHTEIHTVTVTDDFGGTTTQDVTITITGTNDKPVITSGTQAGAVQEDVQLTATGQVQASDVDTGDHQHYSGNATGTYGSFAIAATTGVWTYTLDNAAHQDLAQGESHTEIHTVTVTDDFGGTTTQDVTITITGTNDKPVITSGTQAGAVQEDVQLTATGQVQASDVDTGDHQHYSGNATGTYGSFAIAATTGVWTYTLDNAAHQDLAQGESHTEIHTVTVTDDFGGTTTQDVTITITGTNDKPVITSGTQAGAVQEDVQLTATGQVQASDVDTGDHQHYSGNATGTYGSFAIAATTGVWTYTLDNAAHQDLAQGESHTEIHTVTVTDDFGGTTTQDVTITITGTNDKPVITSGTQAGAVQEDVQLTATGQVQASDVDTGDHQHYSGNATGTYGSFAIAATTGVWTYTLDNAAHQDLAQGESHTEIHTVTVTDDFGGTTTQDVTITITGTNDKPVITSGTQAGAVQEDVQLTATGQVQASDVDTGDHQHYSGNATGTYGSFAIAATTGVWTYTLDNAAHQDLAQGESHTEIHTVTVTDDFGGTTTQDVTITITGTNDKPVITSGTQAGAVQEDVQLTATGQVQASDVDTGDHQHYSGNATGTYGSFAIAATTGVWTYTLDNAAHQDLAQGESHTEIHTVTVTDDFGGTTTQDVTITITGTNDKPVITSGTQAGAVQEDVQLTATGQVQASDVDTGDHQHYSGNATGTYGSFAIAATTGVWTYTLDNAAHQDLAQGESHTEIHTVTVTDDFGGTTTQDVTITITGTNDKPVITSGTQAGAVQEDVQLTATGQVQASDVDTGDHQHYSGNATGTYGSFAIAATTGVWTYTLDNAAHQDLAQGESHTEIHTVTVTDDFGGTTTQDVTITITGTNDKPVITSGTQAGAVQEDVQLTATGQVQASDVDTGDHQHYSGNATGTYGSFAIAATTGVWTYTLDNAAHQDLAQGESHTEIHTVTVTDDFGGTTTQDVTITITGTNDKPVITSGTQAGAVQEDVQLTATGQVQASDVDTGDHQHYSGNATGTYGSFAIAATTGVWTYTLDNAAHQDLAQGESHTEIHTVTVTDDFGGTTTQDVTITITGTNDAAAISGTASGSVIEAGGVANATPGTPTASGTLTDTDVDNAANTFTAIPAGHATTNGYGTFGMTTGGVWTYTLNNNNAAVQALNVNGTLTDTFSVTTIDGTAKTVTVTINGANDAAVISGTKTGTVIEAGASNGGGTPTATGTLTDTDVDNTPNTFAVASGSASHGIYSMTVGGVWTYTLNNADAAVNALNTGQTLADTFTVTTVDGTQQAINITIQGTTDAQLITSIVSSQQGNASTPTTITINFGVTGVINSFANAADPSSYVTLSNPSKGSLSLVANSGIFDAAHGTYSFQVNKSGGSNGSTFDVSISAGAFHDANGNINSAASATGLHPAGISGEAINLGLAGHDSGDVLNISGAPSGWTLSEGTRNDDGTWTVVTNDASSLSVTSPDGYVGAMVLQIDQQFTAVDGSINHLFVADNVEAYAQGGPVFALSTEDHLTGSVGNDTFVFAGPIGADTIKSFDTAHDKIDLVHFTGFDTFADVQAHTTTDSAGNAVVSLGDGQSITLVGVNAGALSVDNFAFDQTPVTNNSGNMVISDGAIMPLGGEVDNTGVISLTAGNDLTSLQLIQHGLTLLGGGEVKLSDSSENVISGTGADVTLTNVDNTISGAGQLGDGLLTLINEGTIDATGTHALVIDTGANVVLNSGTLEASGSGGLVVDGDVFNSGFMWADGGNITIHGDVTGSGSALIDGSATLEFGGASAENTTFAEGSTGMLKLDHSLDFSGIVSGFGAGLQLDLADINFGSNATVGYSANQDGKGGILSVSDGGHTANINLAGQYAAEDFHILSDSGTGTLVTYVHTGLAPTDFHIV